MTNEKIYMDFTPIIALWVWQHSFLAVMWLASDTSSYRIYKSVGNTEPTVSYRHIPRCCPAAEVARCHHVRCPPPGSEASATSRELSPPRRADDPALSNPGSDAQPRCSPGPSLDQSRSCISHSAANQISSISHDQYNAVNYRDHYWEACWDTQTLHELGLIPGVYRPGQWATSLFGLVFRSVRTSDWAKDRANRLVWSLDWVQS